jgi:hypothetical protein
MSPSDCGRPTSFRFPTLVYMTLTPISRTRQISLVVPELRLALQRVPQPGRPRAPRHLCGTHGPPRGQSDRGGRPTRRHPEEVRYGGGV